MAGRDPRDVRAHRRPGSGGGRYQITMPSDHSHVLGHVQQSSAADVTLSIGAALEAGREWAALPFDERAAVFLRAADLIAGPWRARINAATMLGQGKTVQQAEIDAACELIDSSVQRCVRVTDHVQPAEQPLGQWNRMDYRPLDGFVYAITPFNFTAIAGNLPTSAALMGNPVLWKPAVTQSLAASVFVDVLESAGMPPGVINMLPGHGSEVSSVALSDPNLAGIHFTGSTRVFQGLWAEVGGNISRYRSYPRIVGRPAARTSWWRTPAQIEALVVALIIGAFSTRARSVPRRRGPTSRAASGTGSGTTWSNAQGPWLSAT